VRERHTCRLCDGPVSKVFELKPAPIANSFPVRPDRDAKKYPLELMQCADCGHVQQRYVLDGLFESYKYRTPSAAGEYWKPVAKRIADAYPEGQVLEIGCNNGVFLDLMIAEGLEAWGVDPAADHPNGVVGYFGDEFAKGLGEFDVVVGNNVFAHIDDLQDVFKGIRRVLKPDGTLIFEVQYLVDLVASGAFDMIYHEHLDYHTLKPLQGFLKRHGFVMTAWEHLDTHGGSIRVTAHKVGAQCEIPEEPLDWDGLRARVASAGERVKARIGAGKVPAFGAAAKASTLINEFGLQDHISFVADDTKEKQFRYIAGTDIPVFPVDALRNEPVLLTAWNYADAISKRIPNRLIHPFA
jgi:SAM-dependent methyltransferase